MDYGSMLGDSFEYAKEAVWGKWLKWVFLFISMIIFPLFMGYLMEIYRGKTPAPEFEDWVKLLIDGIKLFIVELIYSIPLLIVAVVFFGGSIALMAGGGSDAAVAAAIGGMLLGILVMIVVGFLVGLIAAFGFIRFARTDSFGEAFNISAILAHIGAVGWGSYIIALIVLWVVTVVIGLVIGIIMSIPFIGWVIAIFLYPVLGIFTARYMTLIYDSAAAPA
ncbi:DUF4013 domain-containing protein [Methanofollis aquaemaris]|uniref:DUF4013 domain-containing protein n=1 Tax=Methanofollis aquaemaris TaxID=126734 RepID=A0A8A3S9P2_9EURY|nr:DUF4013 domain-containing protein [Methanofollis aquaemaris]QSZ68291.1 DUF4013 domain-containing protein [Methanofollis aquaemaris]